MISFRAPFDESLPFFYSTEPEGASAAEGAAASAVVKVKESPQDDELLQWVTSQMKKELGDKIQTTEEFIEHLHLFRKEGGLLYKLWKKKVEESHDLEEKTALEANFKVRYVRGYSVFDGTYSDLGNDSYKVVSSISLPTCFDN